MAPHQTAEYGSACKEAEEEASSSAAGSEEYGYVRRIDAGNREG